MDTTTDTRTVTIPGWAQPITAGRIDHYRQVRDAYFGLDEDASSAFRDRSRKAFYVAAQDLANWISACAEVDACPPRPLM